MWDDKRDLGTPGHGAAEKQIHDRARGVEEELEHRSGILWERDRCVAGRHARRRGVDEDDALPPVDLVEDRIQRFVAQVHAVVVRLHREAVCVQRVERVGDFLEGAGDVGHGQGSPEAEFRWGAGFQFRGEGVAVARQLASQFVVPGFEVRAWGGDADDGLGDVGCFHHVEVAFFAPGRDSWHAIGKLVAIFDAGCAVAWRHEVRVRVNLCVWGHVGGLVVLC